MKSKKASKQLKAKNELKPKNKNGLSLFKNDYIFLEINFKQIYFFIATAIENCDVGIDIKTELNKKSVQSNNKKKAN